MEKSGSKVGAIVWIVAFLSGLCLPIMGYLLYPWVFSVPMDMNFYLSLIAVLVFWFVLMVFLFLKAKRGLSIKPLNLSFKSSRKPIIYGLICFLLIGSNGYLTGKLIYDTIDIRENWYDPSGIYLTSPKLGAPEFVEPGSSFYCNFSEGSLSESSNIIAQLNRGQENIILTTQYQTETSLKVTIPGSVSDGLYSLNLSLGEITLYEPYAIQVWDPVDHLDEQFTVAHITDTHVSPTEYPELMPNLEFQVETLALLNPDLVILTGDLTDDGLISQYEILKDLVLQFGNYSIPIFMILGNHDQYSAKYNNLEYWYRNFGPEHFYRDIPGQNLRIINFNTGIRDENFKLAAEWSFLVDSLESLDEGQESILVCHIPSYRFCDWATTDEQEAAFNDLCDLYDVEAVFAGHSHVDRVVARRSSSCTEAPGECSNEYPLLTLPFEETAYIETAGKTNGPNFRLTEFDQGKIVNCTYDLDNDGELDQKSSIFIEGFDFGDLWLTQESSNAYGGIIKNPLNIGFSQFQTSVLLPEISSISSPTIILENLNQTGVYYSGQIYRQFSTAEGLRVDLGGYIPTNTTIDLQFSFS